MFGWAWCSLFFFFQAEDGIRYLVRSRGLGDVYKRQAWLGWSDLFDISADGGTLLVTGFELSDEYTSFAPVSYTHLTLPTSDLV